MFHYFLFLCSKKFITTNQLSFSLKYLKIAKSVLIEISFNTDNYIFDLMNFYGSKYVAYREICLYSMCL